MSVRAHTHGSNRARPLTSDKKAVFKSVLDNPYRVHWPPLPLNLQNAILARLLAALDGVSDYNLLQDRARRQKKRSCRDASAPPTSKKQKCLHGLILSTHKISDMVVEENTASPTIPEKPDILNHMVIGINQVTRALESQLQNLRSAVKVKSNDAANASNSRPTIKLVFVCRDDIDPPILINHIPYLIAAYNSICHSEPIKTAILPRNSENVLAEAVGLRRAAILALDITTPSINDFLGLLDSIPPLTAAWLTGGDQQLIPTHIKQLRTTAPIDMKASKERRANGKRAARERRSGKTSVAATSTETVVPLG